MFGPLSVLSLNIGPTAFGIAKARYCECGENEAGGQWIRIGIIASQKAIPAKLIAVPLFLFILWIRMLCLTDLPHGNFEATDAKKMYTKATKAKQVLQAW